MAIVLLKAPLYLALGFSTGISANDLEGDIAHGGYELTEVFGRLSCLLSLWRGVRGC